MTGPQPYVGPILDITLNSPEDHVRCEGGRESPWTESVAGANEGRGLVDFVKYRL